MEPGALLDALVDLAREAGVTVKELPRGGGDPPPTSDACRIRGEPWLLLARSDSLEDRIDAAARAVLRFAPEIVEGRFLPPAVRARLDATATRATRVP